MKVKELIDTLRELPEETEAVCFAEGQWYPILQIIEFKEDNHHLIELGCGWLPIFTEEEE